MATTEKIRKDIEKTREKIAEQQKRLRALALEDNARKNLKTVKGLGRNYSWRERFGKEFCTYGNG